MDFVIEKKNVRKKILFFVRKNKWLLSFVLGFISYYMYLSYSEMAGGRYSPIFADSLEIYIPAIRQFCRDIINGQSVNYSWTNSLGMNTVAYNAYNVFSVTNLLYLLFFNADVQIVTCISLSVKAGLSAMFFEYYIDKVWKIDGEWCVILSLCYALSSYQVCYNMANMIWMDGYFMLPLILYILHNLHQVNNRKWLAIALAYLILANFYMAYIVGIFCFFYFFFLIIPSIERGSRGRQIMSFFFSTLIAILIDAFMIVPTVVSVIINRAEDASMGADIDISLGDIVNQLFFGQAHGWTYSSFPYIYCGIIVLVLFPAFFLLYRKDLKLLIGWTGLVVGTVLSCLVSPLYLFWHAFDAPDGWGWRFSFLISFELCILAGLALKRIKKLTICFFIIGAVTNAIIYFCLGIVLRESEHINTNTWIFGLINLVLYVIYAIYLCFMKNRENSRQRIDAAVIIGAIIVVELVSNGYCINYRNQKSASSIYNETYAEWVKDHEVLLEKLDNNEFSRVRFIGDLARNTDTMFGVNGTSDFFTIENYTLRNTLKNLGVSTSARVIEDIGYTPFLEMILGVKYKMYCKSYDSSEKDGDESYVEVNDESLGIAFLVDEDILNCSLDDRNDFVNINKLASAMAGYSLDIFEVNDSEIAIYENGINYEYGVKHMFIADENVKGNKLISLFIPEDGRDAYIQFDFDESVAFLESPLLLNGEENINENRGLLSKVYVKKMDKTEYGNSVTILMRDNTFQKVYVNDIFMAYILKEKLSELYETLSPNKLLISSYKDGYVKGKIDMKEGKVLFTSIPYEEGWEVTANGQDVETIPVVDNTFLAIKLPKGEYELEFKYSNPYLEKGLWISLLGIFLFLLPRKKY